MKSQLQEILDFINENLEVSEEEKAKINQIIEKADKRLISRKHHSEILSKYERSRKNNWRSLLFFALGIVASSFGHYFHFKNEFEKSEIINAYVNNISELCERRAFNAARQILKEAQSVDPQEPRLLTEKLRIDLEETVVNNKQSDPELIQRCEMELKYKPDIIWLNNNLAILYQRKGEFDKAIACLRKNAILGERLNSQELVSISLLNLAISLLDQGRLDSAGFYFNKVQLILNRESATTIVNYDEHINKLMFNTIRWKYFMGDYNNCIIEATLFLKRHNMNKADIGQAYLLKAEALQEIDKYKNQSSRTNAMITEIEDLYFDALGYFSEDPVGFALAASSLSHFYSVVQQCDYSSYYIEKAIVKSIESNLQGHLIRVFGFGAQTSSECKEYEKAFIYNQLCMELCRNFGDSASLLIAKSDSIRIAGFIQKYDLTELIQKVKQKRQAYFQKSLVNKPKIKI